MKNFTSLYMFLILSVLLPACASKPLCPVVDMVATSAATTIAAQCGCNEAAVYASVFPLVNVAGMCNTTGGPIAGLVCPLAGQELSSLLGGTFPASWQCTNAASCVGTVLSPLVSLCETLPFKP